MHSNLPITAAHLISGESHEATKSARMSHAVLAADAPYYLRVCGSSSSSKDETGGVRHMGLVLGRSLLWKGGKRKSVNCGSSNGKLPVPFRFATLSKSIHLPGNHTARPRFELDSKFVAGWLRFFKTSFLRPCNCVPSYCAPNYSSD